MRDPRFDLGSAKKKNVAPLIAAAAVARGSSFILSLPAFFKSPLSNDLFLPPRSRSLPLTVQPTLYNKTTKINKKNSLLIGRDRLDQAPRPARLGRLPRRRRRAPRAPDRARRPGRGRAQLGLLLRGEGHAGEGPARDGRAVEGGVQREIRLLCSARGLADQQEEVRDFFPFFSGFFFFRGDEQRKNLKKLILSLSLSLFRSLSLSLNLQVGQVLQGDRLGPGRVQRVPQVARGVQLRLPDGAEICAQGPPPAHQRAQGHAAVPGNPGAPGVGRGAAGRGGEEREQGAGMAEVK